MAFPDILNFPQTMKRANQCKRYPSQRDGNKSLKKERTCLFETTQNDWLLYNIVYCNPWTNWMSAFHLFWLTPNKSLYYGVVRLYIEFSFFWCASLLKTLRKKSSRLPNGKCRNEQEDKLSLVIPNTCMLKRRELHLCYEWIWKKSIKVHCFSSNIDHSLKNKKNLLFMMKWKQNNWGEHEKSFVFVDKLHYSYTKDTQFHICVF